MKCIIENCQKKQRTKMYKWCSAHEWHWRKYGDPLAGQIETHGMRKSPIYRAWANMKQRCNDPNYTNFKNWGGKGIKVCIEWDKSFTAFYNDMGETFQEGLWLDRIDNSKDYSKENCRWATPREQQENRTNNRFIEFNGKKQTLTRWAEDTGIKRATLTQRFYKYGWSIERLLTEGAIH